LSIRMMPKPSWIKWCVRNNIDLTYAQFASDLCYLGAGMRSRPGTLIVTPAAIFHQSYSWFECIFALGEPKLRVIIPSNEILHVRKNKLSASVIFRHVWPEAHFTVVLKNSSEVDLIVYSDASVLESILVDNHFYLPG
jgi:hypothetical protein